MRPLYSDSEWPSSFATYDIEADHWIEVKLVCHLDESGNRLDFPTVGAYLDWLYSPAFQGDIVFAHAGGHYDHRFLMAEAKDRGWNFRTAITGGSIVILTLTNDKGRAIKFGDSFRLMPDSLAQIGKTVKLEKMDLDPSRMHEHAEADILEYCFRDCEIVLKGLQLMRQKLQSVNADFAFTLASIASRYNRRNDGINWDHFVKRKGRKLELREHFKEWDIPCYDAYFGGRTEMFKRGTFTTDESRVLDSTPNDPIELSKPVYWYDIVSSYPASMLEPLPLYYKGFYPAPRNLGQKGQLEKFLSHCGITECRVYVPPGTYLPVLPWKDDSDRLIFACGHLPPPGDIRPGRWTNVELLAALEQGAEIHDVKGQWRFAAEPWLRGFVQNFYKLRQEAKDAGDDFGSYAYKILLNSSYGKLVETVQRRSYMTTGEIGKFIEEQVERGLTPDNVDKMILATNTAGIFAAETEERGPFRHTAAGAYITAYSRLRLHRKAVEMHKRGAEIFYCDTDSLMIDMPFEEDTGKSMGKWEHVATLKELELVLPKVYRAVPEWHEKGKTETVYKCKGCPIERKFEEKEKAVKRWQAFKDFRFDDSEENARILEKEGVTGFVSDVNYGSIHPRRKQTGCKTCSRLGVINRPKIGPGVRCPSCLGNGSVDKPLLRALRSEDKKRVWDGANSQPIEFRGNV